MAKKLTKMDQVHLRNIKQSTGLGYKMGSSTYSPKKEADKAREKDVKENGFNGTKNRAKSLTKAAAATVSAAADTAKRKRFENGVKAAVKMYNQYKETAAKKSSPSSSSSTGNKSKHRYKEISEKANASRTAEQNAAIEKNNNRLYWKNKERMNNSGSYKAMMQSRTKGAMQKASDKNLYGGDNISNIKGEKKSNTYKQYEKAFGRKKGR